MARFRCRACAKEGTFIYDGHHACPNCGSVEVQFALGIEEFPDDHPFVESLRRLAAKAARPGQHALRSELRDRNLRRQG
jgi:hypothetical protein